MGVIYIVTSGDYSEYRIDAVFSTEELARQYINRRKEEEISWYDGSIEPWDIDSSDPEWLEGKYSIWHIGINYSTADILWISKDASGEWDTQISHYPEMKRITMFVTAKTEEEAAKIAMEKRTAFLLKEGIEDVTK